MGATYDGCHPSQSLDGPRIGHPGTSSVLTIRSRLSSTRAGPASDQVQPPHDLVQLLLGIAGPDQQAVCYAMFPEPRGLPGEHDAPLSCCCMGPGFSAVSEGHGVKPVAVQKPAQAAEIRIHHETDPAQRPGSQSHKRRNVECLEDRVDADSVTIGNQMIPSNRIAVHEDQLDLE